jgi:acyl-CoA dehydrogenase family member 9
LPWVFKKAATEERFLQSQYQHERLADIAIDLYVGSCVLSRLDHLLTRGPGTGPKEAYQADLEAGQYFLKLAFGRIAQNFTGLFDNSDDATTAAAVAALARS